MKLFFHIWSFGGWFMSV